MLEVFVFQWFPSANWDWDYIKYMEPSIPILMGELLECEDFIKSAVEAEWRVEL